MSFHIGQRLIYDGNLCTVRYQGPLQGAKGDWLGIEWDDPTRGKHNGSYNGEQVFQCLSPSNTAASFLRPSRHPDPTRTVIEAIRQKYGGASQSHVNSTFQDEKLIEISGKTVEEIGFDKVSKQIALLENLKIVLLDGLKICGLTKQFQSDAKVEAAQAELADICPSITELDIGYNPVESWQDVADICTALPNLRVLRASGLRLNSFSVNLEKRGHHPFASIEELHLNECLLTPDQILQTMVSSGQPLFPNLKSLWISQNNLNHFHSSLTSTFQSINHLVLENNHFTTLQCVANLLSTFPNVKHLSLQGNMISSIGSSLLATTNPNAKAFQSIDTLNLAGNQVSEFSFIDALPNIFPNLISLRISRNPLYTQSTDSPQSLFQRGSSDVLFYLTLARIPRLRTLNYTTITATDRQEGEIYYLSVAEKDIKTTLNSTDPPKSPAPATSVFKTKYPLYETLCTKYQRESVLAPPTSTPAPSTTTSSSKTYAPGTLGSRIVNATFYIPSSVHTSTSTPPRSFSRSIPTTIPVYTLKALLSRQFTLRPLQFKLIYESPEIDPIRDTTRKTTFKKTKEGETEWDDWGDWDVDIPLVSEDREEGAVEKVEEEKWVDGFLIKEGKKWKRREVEILDGMRPWGDFLDNGDKEVRVRVEPFPILKGS